ncbi:MAG: outer membrane protein and related peptidoglycan-associated protein-like protein [Actinomycetia bacterium]|nr:outer membrane protein and related peptidoglycan-associated protein-like protein [Actinomycetes bacterium]
MRSPRLVLVLAVGALAVSACSGSGKSSGSARTPGRAGASVPASAGSDTRPALATVLAPRVSQGAQAKLELVGLNRLGAGNVVVQLRITNLGSGASIGLGAEIADETMGTPEWHWPSGIGLLDPAARKILMPYRTAGEGCLCSTDKDITASSGWSIRPGLSQTVFAVLPAPSGGAKTTTVVTPMGPPMVDVPISDERPTAPPGQVIPDPGSTTVTPLSYPIETSTEAFDKTEETQTDGKDVHVNLSSDVLFALGKADLSPQAEVILRQTARQIDASPGSTVQVDGHADSSGTDEINDPLSQQRADMVKTRLAALVTRSGVGFNAKGYGSHRPLYTNDSDEGRRRNRRVTVTFERQAPSAPPAAGTPVPSGRQGPQVQGRNDKGTSFTAQVTGLRPIGNGLGVLTYKITNKGKDRDEVNLAWGEDWMKLKYIAASTVAVVDPAARLRYPAARYIIDGGGGRNRMCVCQGLSGVRLSLDEFGPDETKELWAVVALPATSPVSVDIGKFPRLSGVAVS